MAHSMMKINLFYCFVVNYKHLQRKPPRGSRNRFSRGKPAHVNGDGDLDVGVKMTNESHGDGRRDELDF